MTIEELKMNLNLVLDEEDKQKILVKCASRCAEGYFFVDDDGARHLFSENGSYMQAIGST